MRLSPARGVNALSGTAIVMLLFAGASTRIEATCANAQPFQHALGGFLDQCDTGTTTSGYVFVMANPAVNSVANDFVCEADTQLTSQLNDCQPEAGTGGDGKVTLNYDFGGINASPGCPNPAGVPDVGRLISHVVAPNGWSIVLSVGYSTDFGSFVVETAHPWSGTSSVLPLSCGGPGRSFILVEQMSPENGQVHARLTLSTPPIASDCDPGTGGPLFGTCPQGPASIPARTPGRIYLKVGSCGGGAPVADLRTTAWTFAAAPDAQGKVDFTFPPPPAGQCTYLGGTYRLGGTEVPAIAGFIPVPADILCTDADSDGWSSCAGDCNDSNAQIFPGNTEVCDGLDNNCDGAVDNGLGQTSCGVGACARVVPSCVGGHPQACVPGTPTTEICDTVDNDCNGAVDDRDADQDGYAICTDCNDTAASIHPGAAEICNGLDDDCDQKADDFQDVVDQDGDGVAGACDNCPLAHNPSQADSDGDRIGNSCDNCILVANANQIDHDFDQRGDVCDNCPDEANTLQDDFDTDARGDACDNCPFLANPDQGDLDQDAEGNVCDLNDGLILIQVPDDFFVEWQRESGFSSFNVYRGDVAVLRQSGVYTQNPAVVPLAARTCGVTDAYVLDGVVLPVGKAVFFLVTGNGPGGESGLGTNSAGQPRPNTNPCP